MKKRGKTKNKKTKKAECQSILVKICKMIKGKVVCKERKFSICSKCNKK